MVRIFGSFGDKPDRHEGLAPGEGPSADRFRPNEMQAQGGGGGPTAAPERHVTLNQDGSVLGEGGEGFSGADRNPLGSVGQLRGGDHMYHPGLLEQPIGGTEGVLRQEGERREVHEGVAGAPGAGDKGTSGWLGGDPSNIGMQGDEQI